jgi:hypothetical protein
MKTDTFNAMNTLKNCIAVINASNAFMLTARQAVYNLGERYFITNHEWENSNHCYHALEESHNKQIVPQFCILCVDKESCEASDMLKLLYRRYHSTILVVNLDDQDVDEGLSLAMRISYLEAGASGYVRAVRECSLLTKIIQFLQQGYGLFQWQAGYIKLLRKTKLQRVLSPLSLQLIEMLVDKAFVFDLDTVITHHLCAIDRLLLDELGFRCLNEAIPCLIEAKWEERIRKEEERELKKFPPCI